MNGAAKSTARLMFTVLLLAPFVAQAKSNDDKVPPQLQKKYDRRLEEMRALDGNQDGVLQVEELMAKVGNEFIVLDDNKDGFISETERQAAIQRFKEKKKEIYGSFTEIRAIRLKNRYKNADANEDDQISKEEYEAYFGKRYRSYDRNRDGIITAKEYRTDVETLPRSYTREED